MKKLIVAVCLLAGAYGASAQNSTTTQAPAHSANVQKAQHAEQVVVPASATQTKSAQVDAAKQNEHPTVAQPTAGSGKAACCKKGHTCAKKEGEAK